MSVSDNGREKMSTAKKDDTFESIGSLTMPVREWKMVVAINVVDHSMFPDYWMFNVNCGSGNFTRRMFIERTDLPLDKIVALIRDALNRIICK